MEAAKPFKPSAGSIPSTGDLVPYVSGSRPEASGGSTFSGDVSNIHHGPVFWDWHSYIIIFFAVLVTYHLWSFRALYFRIIDELARSIRNRVFNADIRVNLEIRTDNSIETVTVVLTGPSEPAELEIGTIEVHEILETDDHFHDCLEA